jgi:hypothetical protein
MRTMILLLALTGPFPVWVPWIVGIWYVCSCIYMWLVNYDG